MGISTGRDEIQQVAEGVRKHDLEYLKQVVPETLLNLDQVLNYRFVVDGTFVQILTEIKDGLNLPKRIAEIKKELDNPPTWLNDQIKLHQDKIDTLIAEIAILEGQKVPQLGIVNDVGRSKDDVNKARTAIATLEWEIQSKKSNISTFETTIQTIKTKKDKLDQEKKNLDDFWKTYKSTIGWSDRDGTRKRLKDLIEIGKKFDINKLIPRKNYNIGEPVAKVSDNLDALFAPALWWAHPIKYTICDSKSGDPIPNIGGEMEVTTDDGQTVKLKRVEIDKQTATFENLQIEPLTGITFPVNLRLAIRGRIQDPVTWMNMDHFKNLDITINQPNFDQAKRKAEVNAYNSAWPGDVIQDALTANQDNIMAKLEREAVFRVLEKANAPKFGKLTTEQKEELYQEIHKAYTDTLMPPARAAGLTDMDNFDTGATSFLDRITWDKHESNKPEFTKNAKAYRDFVHDNLEDQIKKYFERRLDEVFTKNIDGNTYLKAQLTNFLTGIEWRRNDDEEVAGQKIHEAIDNDIGKNDRMIKHKSKKLLRREYGTEDDSYMKFYNGSSYEIKDQNVNIATNTKVEDLKNSEPVKYDIRTDITSTNQIAVTIKFPNTDKRYMKKEITLKQGEVSTLSESILNCKEIVDFKVRTHIVYNLLVSMVKISAKKNLLLKYRDPLTKRQREISMDDKNISLYERDDSGAKRRIETLFDYDSFATTNTFHGANDSKSLQTAIDELMGHFNYAMNTYHENYRKTVKSRLLKTKVSANWFWTSPIKTIMNIKGVRKFDFTTNAANEEGTKKVNITFEKNLITLEMWDIKVTGNDLGKMLEYRKNKVRVFDGVERNIIFAFYNELVTKLRANAKINRSIFGARDPLTQNIYVMDEDGQVGVVASKGSKDKTDILKGKDSGIIKKKDLNDIDAKWARRICSDAETKEAFMNPCIMGNMIKNMNKRMSHR